MSQFELNKDRCPQCGDTIAHDAPEGLCWKCLFILGAGDPAERSSRRLDHYELGPELGRGGAGVVFRSRQLALNRAVAVKLLLNARLLDQAEIDRFRHEAETVAQLQHPNIVTIHEVGEENGQPWFSMPLIDGKNLADAVRNVPFQNLRAARIVRKIAIAVAHAHARGVLHRDLKPSNVLLDIEDEPHVTDFGLALRIHSDSAQSGSGTGTPAYMSPEQVSGSREPVTERTDVWGLGAILYHLLTARPPFVASTREGTVAQVLTADPISPRMLNPALSLDLETICLKCLRKSPAARYQSALEVAEELERFGSGLPIRARAISPLEKGIRWARRRPLAAALLSALVLALTGWFGATEERRQIAVAAAVHSSAAAAEKQRLLTHQFLSRGFEALSRQDQATSLPWLIAAWASDRTLAASAGDRSSASTPSLQYSDNAHSMRFEAALSAIPHIATLWQFSAQASSVDLSSDGRLAVAGGEDRGVVAWNPHTGKHITEWKEEWPIVRLRLNPTATLVAIASSLDLPSTRSDLQSRVALYNPTNAHPTASWEVEGKARSIEFSPDGLYIAVATSLGNVEVWNVATAQRVSPVMKHDTDARLALFTPDNARLVSCSFDETARIWDWRTGRQEFLLPHKGYVRSLRISPYGTKVLSASDEGSAQLWDLRTGQRLPKPFQHSSRVYGVAFSRDGKLIATASSDSTARVWDAETLQPKTSPLPHPHRVTRVSFSPNGKYLLTSTSEGLLTIWDPISGLKKYSVNQTGLTTESCWLPSSDGFVVDDMEGLARQWMLPSETPWRRELTLPNSPNSVALNPDQNQVLVGLGGGKAFLWNWDLDSDPVELKLPAETADVEFAGYIPGKSLCWTASRKSAIRLSDTTSGAEVATTTPSTLATGAIRCIRISPRGDELAIGTEAGECLIWNLQNKSLSKQCQFPGRLEQIRYREDGRSLAGLWSELAPLNPQEGKSHLRLWGRDNLSAPPKELTISGLPMDLAFSPNGQLLAVSTVLGASYLLEADDVKLRATLEQPGRVLSVAFSPDSKTLLTAGNQGLSRLWNTARGQLVTSSLSQNGNAQAIFSRDGRQILTWGRDLRAQVWDAQTFEPLLPPFFHQDAVKSAGFSHDGKDIITVSVDLRIRVWPLPPAKLTFAEADRLSRINSGHTVDPTGSVVAVTSSEIARLWSEHLLTK